MISRYGIILSLAAALALGACDDAKKTAEDKAAEEMAEAMGLDDVDVSTNADGSQNVKITDGGTTLQTGSNVSLPEGFPPDVPVYAGSKMVSAVAVPGQGHMIQARSGDKMDKIARFYADDMKAKGWETTGTSQLVDMHVLQFKKGERSASVTLTVENSQTMVSITTSGS